MIARRDLASELFKAGEADKALKHLNAVLKADLSDPYAREIRDRIKGKPPSPVEVAPAIKS